MALERGVAITRGIAAEALARRSAASDSDQMSFDLIGRVGDDDE